MKYLFLLLITIMIIVACKESPHSQIEILPEQVKEYPSIIKKMFNAHGGLDKWESYQSISFQVMSDMNGIKEEVHTIDLVSRKILINGDGYDIGFNGKDVWISPDRQHFGNTSPRFYHNLLFYFHALVFLVADNGVIYRDMGLQNFNNKDFHTMRISYENGIGDSSNDEYILYIDPGNFRLHHILYTVTYFTGEGSDHYNALFYNDWVKVEELLLPKSFTGYQYEKGSLGKKKYEASFSSFSLSHEVPDQQIFEIPSIAEIDD